MSQAFLCKTPRECTQAEGVVFSERVLEGFHSNAATLPERIRQAHHLAWWSTRVERMAGIAALKAPGRPYREEVFRKVDVPADANVFTVELGWVYTVPEYRGQGIARALCEVLLESAEEVPVFATTRSGNITMQGILTVLGFHRAGVPYRRGEEELVLFLRAGTMAANPA